ncbi:MAG: hypothetical protein H7A35_03525 [Planctomycetales bacterium]|nr:hypothetical protein [bacterium]UNM09125.1 MAG: hypothetical protein H7A35_03525 [Planctomycetales bacterium]
MGIVISILLALLLTACAGGSSGPGIPSRGAAGDFVGMNPGCCWELVARERTLAGSISMRNNAGQMFVEVEAAEGYLLESLSLYAGCEIPDRGNPASFPWQLKFNPPVQSCTIEVPVAELPAECCMQIASFAVLRSGHGRQRAWGAYWRDGKASYDFSWKSGGGGISTKLFPVPKPPPDCIEY